MSGGGDGGRADTRAMHEPSGADAMSEAGLRAVVVARTPRRKIQFIKQIRGISGLGLKEAKDVADLAPPFVLVWASAEMADVFVETMEKQLGETGVFEVYDADPGLEPVVARRLTTETILGPLASGCAAKAAVLAGCVGAGVYLLG